MMLLTISNLPHHMRYTDIKTLISQKCGIRDLILDNLVSDSGNSTKKVTVGLASEGDADNLRRNINGIYFEGQQLHVEESRKKVSSKQYNSGQNNSANTSNMAMTPEQYNMMMQSYCMMQGMYMMQPPMNDQQQNYSTQGQDPSYMQNYAPQGSFDANYPSGQWGQQQYGGYGSQNSGQRQQGNHEAKSQQQQNYSQDRSWSANTSGPGNSSFNTNSRYEQNNQQYGQNSNGKRKYPDSQDSFQEQQSYGRRGEPGYSSNAQRNQSQYQSNQQYDNYDGPNSNGNRKLGNQEGRYHDDRNQNSRNDRTWRPDQGNSHNHQEKRSRFEPENNQYGGNYSGYSTQNSRGGFGPKNDMPASSKAGQAPNDFDSWNAKQGNSFSYERSEEKRNYSADFNRPSSSKYGLGFGNKKPEGNWKDEPPRAGNQHNDRPIPKKANFNQTTNPEPQKNQNQKKKKKINIFKPRKTGPNRVIPENARAGAMFTKVNQVTFMCQGASFLQREIVNKHTDIVHRRAVKLIKKKVRARLFNIIEAERICIKSREDAVHAYRMTYPPERDINLVMAMNAQVGQGAPAPDAKIKQQNPAVPKKEPVTPCKPNVGQSGSDFIPLDAKTQNTNAQKKFVPNPLAHGSGPSNPSPQNSAKKNKKKKKGKQVEIKTENTSQRDNLPRYPNGSKATLCEMKRIAKLEREEDIYDIPPLLGAALKEELDAIAEMITDVVTEESEKLPEPSRVLQNLEFQGKKDVLKFINLHMKRRIVNATTNLAVGINYNGGKPCKEKLEALMKQYGAMTLQKSKLRRMHMANFDNFDNYDRLLKLGSCVMDNVQIVFKPMHLIGPRSQSHLSEKQKEALHAKFNFGMKESADKEQSDDFEMDDDVYDLTDDENIDFTDEQLDAIAREECENYAKIMQGTSAGNSQGETAGNSHGETAGNSQGETAGNSQGETAKDVTGTQEVIKSFSESDKDSANNVQPAANVVSNDAANAGGNAEGAVKNCDKNMFDSDVEEVILDSTVVEIEDDTIDEINMDDVDEDDLVDYL